MTKNHKGQSLIEVVLSIGIIALVITGVIFLIISTVSIKTEAFQRKRASEMASVVVENLLEQKNSNSDDFWNLSAVSNVTLSGFEGFTYSVVFNRVVTGVICSSSVSCADATVTISWGNNKSLTVSRFFSK